MILPGTAFVLPYTALALVRSCQILFPNLYTYHIERLLFLRNPVHNSPVRYCFSPDRYSHSSVTVLSVTVKHFFRICTPIAPVRTCWIPHFLQNLFGSPRPCQVLTAFALLATALVLPNTLANTFSESVHLLTAIVRDPLSFVLFARSVWFTTALPLSCQILPWSCQIPPLNLHIFSHSEDRPSRIFRCTRWVKLVVFMAYLA